MKKTKDIKCKHYKGEGYLYKINGRQDLLLCEQCNLNLSQEILKQLAIEVFVHTGELTEKRIDILQNRIKKLEDKK